MTWNHVVGSGSNRILIVGVACGGPGVISGVTYGAASLTLLSNPTSGTGLTTNRQYQVWYLVNPASGSATVTVSFSTVAASEAGVSLDYLSVWQSAPFGTPVTAQTTSATTLSALVTTTATNIILGFSSIRSTTIATYGGSQTQVCTPPFGGTNCPDQVTTAAGGTAVSSSFTWSVADNGAIAAVALVGA
jgi:hypothetical protein